MKCAFMTALALFLVTGFSQAELKIPGSIFKMDELDKAKAKAAENAKPLIFVYTDPGTT